LKAGCKFRINNNSGDILKLSNELDEFKVTDGNSIEVIFGVDFKNQARIHTEGVQTMINVIVNGAKGRMGSEAVKAVTADGELTLGGTCDQGDDLSAMIQKTKAEVVVDFTIPDSRMANVKAIVSHGARAVVGTTGFTPEDLKTIEQWCNEFKTAVLIAPNFAIGAVLMMQFAKEAVKYMPHAEIIELHHDKKLDAPSGTAIKTRELMGNKDIPIHSVRLPGLVAHQEVIFGGLGQTLTIRHDSINRESFMPGVVMGIKAIVKREGLVYGLEKLM
jgi:4-hydroxy-tetrahydrodipicolinate reductase